MKKTILLLIAAMALTACGRIETNAAGVRTSWNGTVDAKPESEGFYTSVVGHVDQYTMKEVPINLENMTPKAHDNLSLKELDATVYYKVRTAQAIRDLSVKRAGSAAKFDHEDFYRPAYFLVESIAKSEFADAVSKHDSLTIHTQRNKLEDEVKKAMQLSLDSSDPGTFEITRVVVRQVLTDPTVEQAIRNVVAKGKEKEAADLQVGIAQSLAEATAKTANTLTPAFLQHEYNQALMKFAEHGGTVILDGSSSGKMISIKQ
jgi:hypothetical protein